MPIEIWLEQMRIKEHQTKIHESALFKGGNQYELI
jgi:hypothetical protein